MGIRLLLSDSTNAEEPGFTESESSVGVTLRRVFAVQARQAHRRGLLRQPHAPGAADHRRRVANGRKVATLGRSMGKNVELGTRLGIITVPTGP
jgi:ribonuclease J